MLPKSFLKLSLLTFSLITSADSWAIGDLLLKLKNINKSPTEIECKDMETKDLASLCAQEACGDPKDYTSVINYNSADRYLDDVAKKEIAAVDEKVIKAVEKAKTEAKGANELLKSLKNKKELSDQEALEYMDSILSMSQPQNILGYAKDHKIKNLKIAKLKNPLSPYFKIYNDLFSKLDLSKNMTEADQLLTLSSQDQLDITKIKFEQFKEALKNNNHNPEQFKDLLATDLNTFNVYDYVATQNFYRKLIESAKGVNIQLEEPLCDESCKGKLLTFLQNFKFPDLEQKAEEALKKLTVEDRIAECKAKVTFASIEPEIAKIEKEWPGIKDRAEKLFLSKFSEHSQGLLKTKMGEVKLINNPLTDKKQKNIEGDLTVKPWGDSAPVVMESLKFQGDSVIPRCNYEGRNAIIITDYMAYHRQKDTAAINVSPYSCEHTETGMHYLAHELGHALSHFMAASPGMSSSSKEEFITIRRCSDSSKKTTIMPMIFSLYEKDKFTTEEDVADLISHLLAPKDNNKLLGCGLILPNEEQYNGLATKRSFLDSHEAGLLRLLVELQYKKAGQIPESCEELIKRKGQKLTKKCI
ncbi:MAG: hypothetical protein NDI69_17920 [Bacteriovoracaceae bacterium]|nr:hypothetical protein [Bacteriovoracaceae bacterium]